MSRRALRAQRFQTRRRRGPKCDGCGRRRRLIPDGEWDPEKTRRTCLECSAAELLAGTERHEARRAKIRERRAAQMREIAAAARADREPKKKIKKKRRKP